jgi:hypothetical protein
MEKQFAPWTFFSWDRRNCGDHKEKSVLMFWSKNESLGIDEEELWWYLDKTIWLSSSFRFWTWI